MNITEEQRKKWNEIKEAWYNKAKTEIKSEDDLKQFATEIIKHLENTHDGSDLYEESVYGAGALGYASVQMLSFVFGMTGFQMGCVMWELIKQLHLGRNKVGMMLLSYDDMLFPQYEYKFKTLPKWAWESLQKEAKRLLEENKNSSFPAHKDVVEHWKNIADGIIPFGYEIEED